MNKDLTVGEPRRVLWRYSLPLFGSVIFQQLYNIADSLVAGKFIGEEALASVGNAYELTLIFIAFAFGCNVGCSVVVARLFGAKNWSRMKSAVSTTFLFSGALCLALMLLGFFFCPALLRVINTPEEVYQWLRHSRVVKEYDRAELLQEYLYKLVTMQEKYRELGAKDEICVVHYGY